MAVDTSLIGKSTGTSRIVTERGPVSNFAKALKDDNPIYHDREAAKAAGFSAIPAPPTWAFAMGNWGTFPELQAKKDGDGGPQVMAQILQSLRDTPGLILHGEQEFEYHRPLVVGDEIVGEGRVVDIYQKDSKGKTMTFIVTENVYKDTKSGDPVLTTRMNLIHRAS
jgi:acyl dehydratase